MARAELAFGFDCVGADHLISIIRPDNARSIRVAEKLGETYERTITLDGVESLVYGIHRKR